MRLRYTRPALADLDAILGYITSHSPKGAERVHERIHSLINLLLSHPRIGTRTDDPTIRRISVSPYPYLIFYEMSASKSSSMQCVTRRAIRPACPDRAEPFHDCRVCSFVYPRPRPCTVRQT